MSETEPHIEAARAFMTERGYKITCEGDIHDWLGGTFEGLALVAALDAYHNAMRTEADT